MEKIEKDEQLLQTFFANNKSEIQNNGFSDSVMKKLPDTNDRKWIVWTFAALGTSITLLIVIYSGMFTSLVRFVQHLPVIYIVAAVFVFPLISVVALCNQRQSCVFKLV